MVQEPTSPPLAKTAGVEAEGALLLGEPRVAE